MEWQEEKSTFNDQMNRIRQATGTRTQLELAGFLGVRRSAMSEAKRRGKIPADWLVAIMRAKNVHPEWILTGNGPCHIPTVTPPGHYETGDAAQERRAKEEALRSLSSKDLAGELLRRIAISPVDNLVS